eukprot:gnl/TRDRNA2_/TRDRNA2_185228_c0_seq1.p1 gnl/TRDRNA2_/TRDRNA2_185228_c0~~gnl/TRDRNA2_/TRDRNA2_185228_c0_seq1.p1  ORF type:complete len:183 (-),score=18.51 gnl/TRDRNA2_/TRDRNA2_185228_c0_seq1:55-603(-)
MARLMQRFLTQAFLVRTACASSLYLAHLCRNHRCDEALYPILDYSTEQGSCVCQAHPCWNDDGVKHTCDDPAYPHLHFYYENDGKLKCGCTPTPHYASIHVSRDKCPGETCDEGDHPILDWDDDQQRCLCRSHPCHNDKGLKHECNNDRFPVLKYREEEDPDGTVRTVCECGVKLKGAQEEL